MSLEMTASLKPAGGCGTVCNQNQTLTFDKNLLTPGHLERQLEDRAAKLLSDRLLLSRGLNPDHEPTLRGILQEYFLRQVQQQKKVKPVSPASRARPGTVTNPDQFVQRRGCISCDVQVS